MRYRDSLRRCRRSLETSCRPLRSLGVAWSSLLRGEHARLHSVPSTLTTERDASVVLHVAAIQRLVDRLRALRYVAVSLAACVRAFAGCARDGTAIEGAMYARSVMCREFYLCHVAARLGVVPQPDGHCALPTSGVRVEPARFVSEPGGFTACALDRSPELRHVSNPLVASGRIPSEYLGID